MIRVAQIMSVTGGRYFTWVRLGVLKRGTRGLSTQVVMAGVAVLGNLNRSLFQFEVASTETTQHVVGVQRRTLDEIRYPVPTIASVLPLRKATVGAHPDVAFRVIVIVTRRKSRKWMRLLGDERMADYYTVIWNRLDHHLEFTQQIGGGIEIKEVPGPVVIDYIAEVDVVEVVQAGRDEIEYRTTDCTMAQDAFTAILERGGVPGLVTKRDPKVPVHGADDVIISLKLFI